MIAFRGFSKRFGRVDAVKHLDVSVAPGEIVALLGPNGSGKTTSIRAAAGLIRPTTGEVLLGQPGRPATEAAARTVCSFLPQRVAFPEMLTGWEVVEFYRALRGATAARAADVIRATALNAASARRVGTYSGGMRQRLALAVAMLADAAVLLLDEPTASLDPDGLCMFYGLIEARHEHGQTVLFSSHQLGDVERLADRFLVIAGGLLVASLSAADLTARLADRGVLKLTLGRAPDGLVDRVREVAPKAVWAADQLVVPAPTAARLKVIDLVRNAGAEIRALSAHDGRLDAFYLDLVGGRA